jgi:hypothetical protein
MKVGVLAATFGIVASAPALADEYYAVTPSGATEMIFAEPSNEVAGKLSAKCIDAGWTIASSSGTEIVCEAPMNFGQALVGQLLMGNSYSTPPRRFFKYTVSSVNGLSRVQSSGWMELQMAFGQVRRTDFAGAEFHNGAMTFLAAAGGHYPSGTTFPNHAYLGIQFEAVADGKFSNLRVTTLESNSAAALAGVVQGDIIRSVVQKRFKDGDDLLDASAKAAKAPSFAMEIVRAGKVMKLIVPTAFRPAHTETLIPIAPPPATVVIANGAASSVADELLKLAKLKQDGLLTQEEFDAQKLKLLGN